MAATVNGEDACFLFDKGEGMFRPLPKDDDARMEAMQELLKGYFELVHTKGKKLPFVAYINEEGSLMKMPPNELGTRILLDLGFSPYATVLGPILIVPSNEKNFTDAEKERIVNAVKMRKKDILTLF
jgi:Domain of unknown function (DUF3846)